MRWLLVFCCCSRVVESRSLHHFIMIWSVAGFLALWAVGAGVNAAPSSSVSSPRVQVRNGTYAGVRNTGYNQDFFLGMPYAQQPVGDLRFTLPQSLNESWQGERDAKDHSKICPGYGVSCLK